MRMSNWALIFDVVIEDERDKDSNSVVNVDSNRSDVFLDEVPINERTSDDLVRTKFANIQARRRRGQKLREWEEM